jgi:hypothetical protein
MLDVLVLSQGRFMKLGGPEGLKKGASSTRHAQLREEGLARKWAIEEEKKKELLANRLHSSIATMELKAELEAEGVPPLSDDDLTQLSTIFNKALTFKDGAGNTIVKPWMSLFKEVRSAPQQRAPDGSRVSCWGVSVCRLRRVLALCRVCA